MIEAAENSAAKSNLLAVEAVPTISPINTASAASASARQEHVRGRRHGGEAAEGHRAVEPVDHRALHPAAGNLQDPRDQERGAATRSSSPMR
jgi:hypothetical protein